MIKFYLDIIITFAVRINFIPDFMAIAKFKYGNPNTHSEGIEFKKNNSINKVR